MAQSLMVSVPELYDKDEFSLLNGLGIGSTLDAVIAELGDSNMRQDSSGIELTYDLADGASQYKFQFDPDSEPCTYICLMQS